MVDQGVIMIIIIMIITLPAHVMLQLKHALLCIVHTVEPATSLQACRAMQFLQCYVCMCAEVHTCHTRLGSMRRSCTSNNVFMQQDSLIRHGSNFK